MKFRTIFAIVMAALLLVAGTTRAVEYPAADGFVTDTAGVLDAGTEQKLEEAITALDKSSGAQIGVAVIPTLDGEPIENYAVKLFEKWGIGQDKEDNGVLLVVAVKDRKMRIETGYGLEGAIPDIRAKEITSTIIGPKFKAGDMAGGVTDGVYALAQDICKEYGVTMPEVMAGKTTRNTTSKDDDGSGPGILIMFFAIFGGLIIFLIIGFKKGWLKSTPGDASGAGWSSSSWDSSSSSDGGGFDGGDSGGGGASDDW